MLWWWGMVLVWLVGQFANRPYVRLDGSLDRNGCCGGEGAWWFGWRAPLRPGPSPQPSPVQRERGMFVADEGIAAVMGVWLFGWQGRFETCPDARRVASLDRNGCCGGEGAWVFGW